MGIRTRLGSRVVRRAVFGGGTAMHVAALVLHPTLYLRRMSMRRGILGPSRPWRIVAIVTYLPGAMKKLFGRAPDEIAVETVRPPQFVSVLTAKPLSRKEQKRTGITRKRLQRQALADVAAAKGVEPA